MQKPIWSDLDHRLSVVRRWGTTQTIHHQSVAEHIFNVERIAVRIAREWFDIRDCGELYLIAKWAHHHEDLEAISGDFPSMVKPYLDEDAMANEHADVLPGVKPDNDDVRKIVKLADMLDSMWFLVVEKKLGNNYLDHHVEYEPTRILQYVEKTWGYNDVKLLKKVNYAITQMFEEASVRHSKRGR